MGSKKLSDPPTPISEQSSFPNQDQEETDTPASLAENSLLAKKIHSKLLDQSALVVDRSDPCHHYIHLTYLKNSI